MKPLTLSFAPSEGWRPPGSKRKDDWRVLRQKILERNDYTCQYCGFRATKYQIVHHINGMATDDDERNLTVICPLCNLIEHAGWGTSVVENVDIYEHSSYSQVEIVQITRKMRAAGESDETIIQVLGLRGKTSFVTDQQTLNRLFGFVTARHPKGGYNVRALQHGYLNEKG